MKQLFSLFILSLFTTFLVAQAPQSINYQGVARNASGVAYAGQQISVRLSVRTGASDGAIEYSETRNVTTNQFGLFNVQIGSGGMHVVLGTFSSIKWNEGEKFLQTEISINGQPFSNLGTTQMISVPYAIHSLQTRQLILPYDTTVNMHNTEVVNIRNASTINTLATISSVGTNGPGISGTSDKKPGVIGYSNSTKVGAVTGGNPVLGGYGIHGYTSATNYTGAGVYGQAQIGSGVKGETATGFGVLGIASGPGGVGVNGQAAANGYGVYALTGTGYGLYALATEPTGIAGRFYQPSTQGKALAIEGNLKISGGTTNPGAGKVLTSDDAGNATWQHSQAVAFRASGMRDNVKQTFAPYTPKKVLFYQQARYNVGNAYDAENSIFFPPFAGVYHFNVQLDWMERYSTSHIEIKLLRGGQITTIAEKRTGTLDIEEVLGFESPSLVLDIALQPNDAVWVVIRQLALYDEVVSLSPEGYKCWFSGHLVTRL